MTNTGSVNRRSLLVSGGVALAGGAIAMAGSARAETAPAAAPGAKRESSRLSMKYRFDDTDMDLFFVVAMGWGKAGGLDVGEVFYIASTIKDGEATSWVDSFAASGERLEKVADDWKAQGWTRQSAQMRLKQFASYRSAWQFAPVGPVFDGLYAKHKAAFRQALPDLGLNTTFFDVPFKGKTLPGVFIQHPNPKAPVVLLLGGADTCFEEIFLTVGRNIYDGGYSIAMADLPGQGATMKDGLHWEIEPEKPIAAIADLLIAKFKAKPGRMALLGYSYGGYFATRAAGHDKRFAAFIATTPLPRPGDLLKAIPGRKEKAAAATPPATAALRNFEILYWKAGVKTDQEWLDKTASMVADPSIVTAPFLSIVGRGEAPEFQRQGQYWHDSILSKNKKFVALDAATGADGHCQAQNRLRMAQETLGWLTTVFKS